jgi:stalled ribosome alternative rescue factor ArfA
MRHGRVPATKHCCEKRLGKNLLTSPIFQTKNVSKQFKGKGAESGKMKTHQAFSIFSFRISFLIDQSDG